MQILPKVLAVAALALVAPAAATAAPPLSLTDSTERIGPGVTLRHLVTLSEIGWTDAQILTVDLEREGVKTDLLTAGAVARGSALSEQVRQAGAVAGVNADFFDINNSGAAIGPEIQGGVVRKSGIGSTQVAGVTDGRLGRLAKLTLDATAELPSGPRPVKSLNDPTDAGANAIIATTPLWGTYSRARGLGTATDVAEVIVTDGKVASVSPTSVGAGQLPPNSFSLAGREQGAAALRALQVGDAVTLRYDLKSDIAETLDFAVGGRQILVKDGVPQPESVVGTDGQAPRTSIGFKDGGKTMLLVTADGRQSLVLGPTRAQMGVLMADLGVETALNLDGGGSTTMVARPLGNPLATVRNVPSDGSERSDPNGVGVFVAPGDGTVHDLAISPADARVFPGLHRTFSAAGVDDRDAPVAADVTWSSDAGAISGATLTAPDAGTVHVRARAGAADVTAPVRVLGKPVELEPSTLRLSFAEPTSNIATLRVNGRDRDGFATSIEPQDLELDYDQSILTITPSGGALRVDPIADGATVLTIRAAGLTARVPVTVGAQTRLISGFETLGAWRFRHDRSPTGGISIVDEGHTGKGLKVDYDFTAATATRSAGAVVNPQITLPGQPLRASVWVKGDGQGQWVTISLRDAANKVMDLRPGYATGTGWTKFSANLPATGVEYPVRIDNVRLIETAATKLYKGSFIIDDVEVEVPSEIDTPPADAQLTDRLIDADGAVDADWTFAALSDVQFTAAAPDLSRVAIAALKRIRTHRPDFVVLNGDIVDTGFGADIALAKQTLEAGGCDMVEDGAPGLPTADTVPCLYVPGNHESYGSDNLDAWKAVFGAPYRTFDHKGVRFVLLNSTRGTLRGSDFAQLPLLRDALEDAADDNAVKRVLVFAHHPTNDPDPGDASQLGDRKEVQLLEQLLTASPKPALMVGSHAQIVNVDRVEGVPYMVLPSSGKSPYGTPDRGGFTGWVRYGMRDGEPRADVRAFAQSIQLTAPDALAAGSTATLGGELVQPNGVANGTRKVPLRYPMSVRWSGSQELAVGGSVDEARRAGNVAHLDTTTRELTALRAGTVTVEVEADSMRDGEDLSPIRTEKTINVAPYVAPPVEAGVGGTVPPTLAVTLGAPASFGTFTAGVERTYEASTTATVTSSAADAALTVGGPRLTNGAFSLTSPLEGLGTVKTWAGPVSNDVVAVPFKQTIAATEPLRTGNYSATLTFTLSTTSP